MFREERRSEEEMFPQPKQRLPCVLSLSREKSSSGRGNKLGFRQRLALPTELNPGPGSSYFSSFPSMHHPYLHREAKLQRLLVIIIQLPSRYPGLNHRLFLALLPSQLELDEEEPPLLPSLHPGPGCRGPDAHKSPWPCQKASKEESGSQGHRYRHQLPPTETLPRGWRGPKP